jgi:hypothetical protein
MAELLLGFARGLQVSQACGLALCDGYVVGSGVGLLLVGHAVLLSSLCGWVYAVSTPAELHSCAVLAQQQQQLESTEVCCPAILGQGGQHAE